VTSGPTAANATIGSTPKIWETQKRVNPADTAHRAAVRTSATLVIPVPVL
jgi:hypothetical protein